jgi:hypothetical protein
VLTAPLIARAVMLDPSNVDFNRFGPSWVAVVGFTFGCFVYTLMLESGIRWLESHWRLPLWANFVLGAPPMILVFAAVITSGGLDFARLIIVTVAVVLIAALWRQPAWRDGLVKGLATLWVVGGIWIWLQSALDLI